MLKVIRVRGSDGMAREVLRVYQLRLARQVELPPHMLRRPEVMTFDDLRGEPVSGVLMAVVSLEEEKEAQQLQELGRYFGRYMRDLACV